MIRYNRDGLQNLIDASSALLKIQSTAQFASSVLIQLSILLGQGKSFSNKTSSFIAIPHNTRFIIQAAIGDFKYNIRNDISLVLTKKRLNKLQRVVAEKRSMHFDEFFIGYYQSKTDAEFIIYIEDPQVLNQTYRKLISIFFNSISIIFDNLHLHEELLNDQTELLYTLSEIAETRSQETGYHIRRVAKYCKLLARKLGMNEVEAEELQMAAAMHDIGKLVIGDHILNKPAVLSVEEFSAIKSHALVGYNILKLSNNKLMQMAAIIALHHHEKFDGTGYPHGLKGEEINFYGRITAVADVFDALSTDRVYRKAWDTQRILDYIWAERGKHFDPVLVDVFFDNLDEFITIMNRLTKRMASETLQLLSH